MSGNCDGIRMLSRATAFCHMNFPVREILTSTECYSLISWLSALFLENISNIVNSSLLTNSECIGGLKDNKVNITSQSECKMHREAQRRTTEHKIAYFAG